MNSEIHSWLPESPEWRFYKAKLSNNRWKYMNFKSYEKFIKTNPIYKDLYYSQATYLGTNKEKELKVFLGSNLVIDFDDVNINNIKKAYELIKAKYPDLKLLYLLQTNSNRHFQMCYESELKDFKIENPKKRIEFYKEKRKELCNYLKENKVKFDKCLFNDPEKRIVRMPISKREGNFITTFRTFEELPNLKFKELAKKEKLKKEAKFIFYKALKTSLEGKGDLQILSFKNPNIKKLLELQKTYKLGNIYLLKFPSETIGFTLKLFSKERCNKIYKAFGKEWKHNFKFIRISKKYTEDKRIIEKGFTPLKVLKSNNSGLYSLQHSVFLKDFFELPYFSGVNYIGNENLKTYEVKIQIGGKND